MKVGLVANMYAYPGNWDKLDALGRHVDLEVITPERWATAKELHPVDPGAKAVDRPERRGDSPAQRRAEASGAEASRARGWIHHPLPTITQGNPFRYVYRPGPLVEVLRRARPDIVHVEQEPESLSLTQLSLLKPLLRYRLVFVAWENVNPLRLGWPMRILNFVLADGAIFGNRAALDRARRQGYRGRAAVLPQYGFEPAPRAPRGLGSPFRVGYAGRLVEEKGVRDVVAAVGALPDAELVVAGDGPLRDEIVGQPGARWLGNLDRDAMDGFWSSLDVLVVPSRTTRNWAEQFGRVIVEAMARDVPVVGSSSGAIPEVIGDAGLVVPEGDVEALAAALTRLRAEDDLRRTLVERGRQRVKRVYAEDIVMRGTVAFYEKVLGAATAR